MSVSSFLRDFLTDRKNVVQVVGILNEVDSLANSERLGEGGVSSSFGGGGGRRIGR